MIEWRISEDEILVQKHLQFNSNKYEYFHQTCVGTGHNLKTDIGFHPQTRCVQNKCVCWHFNYGRTNRARWDQLSRNTLSRQWHLAPLTRTVSRECHKRPELLFHRCNANYFIEWKLICWLHVNLLIDCNDKIEWKKPNRPGEVSNPSISALQTTCSTDPATEYV